MVKLIFRLWITQLEFIKLSITAAMACGLLQTFTQNKATCLLLQTFTQNKATCPRIPKNVNPVQIHYIPGSYLLSARQHERIFILDSLPFDNHFQSVAPKMDLIYEKFTMTDVEYKTSHNQGVLYDCAMFVITNAVALLNNTDPQSVHFVTSEMRKYLRQSLLEGIVKQFPHVEITSTERTV